MENQEIFSGWYYTYFSLAALYLIFLIVFLIFTRRDFCSSNSLRWSKASFGFLIVALLIKSAGYCASGCIIIEYNKIIPTYPCNNYERSMMTNSDDKSTFQFLSKFFMLSTSLPGYFISAAYCIIFFSWCSVCIEVMEKKSSRFYGKSRCVLAILLSVILSLSLVSILIFFFIGGEKFEKVSHISEAICATIRDISLSVAFIIYLSKMWQIFEDPKGSLKSFFNKIFCCGGYRCSRNRNQESISNFINYESRTREDLLRNMRYSSVSGSSSKNSYEAALILMCVSIISALIIRALSIIAYTVITNYVKGDPVCSVINGFEFTKSYFVVFLIEIIFSELVPVFAIIMHRISQPESQPRDTDLGF